MLVENDTISADEPEGADTLALPTVGSVIDERYRVTRWIGAGGMGAVFEAEQLAVGRRCALKFLRTELAGRSRSAARFRREARLLGKLEHEHLTAVLDYGTYRHKSPFLVMEYLEGRTLKHVFEEEAPMPLEPALELIVQVANGMAYVHRQQVVHRDLKPSNLMLMKRSDGRPWMKILDFGIARALEEMDGQLTPSGAELGTVHYMSPEQARGTREVDPRSDVYAIGAILYEALTGARAHPGDSYNAVIFHLLTQPHQPLRERLPTCPLAVHTIVERCLDKDPQRRYADAGELADELARVPRQTMPAAYGPALEAQTALNEPSYRRGRWLLTGAALGSIATATVGLAMFGDQAQRLRSASENVSRASAGDSVALSTPVVTRPPTDPESPVEAAPSSQLTGSLLPTTNVKGAEPVEQATRASERAPVGSKRSSAPVATPPLHPHAPRIASASRIERGAAETGAGPAPARVPDADPTPPDDSFPFLTSNPYGAN